MGKLTNNMMINIAIGMTLVGSVLGFRKFSRDQRNVGTNSELAELYDDAAVYLDFKACVPSNIHRGISRAVDINQYTGALYVGSNNAVKLLLYRLIDGVPARGYEMDLEAKHWKTFIVTKMRTVKTARLETVVTRLMRDIFDCTTGDSTDIEKLSEYIKSNDDVCLYVTQFIKIMMESGDDDDYEKANEFFEAVRAIEPENEKGEDGLTIQTLKKKYESLDE